jgi:dienelactone hydrolase
MTKHILFAALAALSLSSLSASAQTATKVTFTGPSGTGLESGLLSGVIYRPANYTSSSNFPAVVMMHGCGGMWSNRDPKAMNSNGTPNLQNHIEKWGWKLASEGIVALAVDSYTRRKPSPTVPDSDWQNQCNGETYGGAVDPYTTRVLDARAAWNYLAGDSRINAARIGMLGWSQGGQAVMVESAETSRTNNTPRTTATPFSVSVVFYPGCGSDLGFGSPSSSYWRPSHDFRMNLAELDPLRANCETRDSIADSLTSVTVLRITYDDANHGFDSTSQTWPSSSCTGSGDTCAMQGADINSWIFFRDRLL